MTQPLVSVIVPTHNGAPFIRECLDSALEQTYDELEVVVVDDCSTDATAEIVTAYAAQAPERVRLFRSSSRQGPCRARNEAIAKARGSLIAWLDHDDVWLPTKIERQVARFEDEPVALVYSDWDEIDAHGRTLPRVWPHVLIEGDILGHLFVLGCFICSSSVVFRRSALARRRLRLREEDFSFGDDYALWLALSLDWRAACERDVLVRYRRHEGNESSRRPGVNFHLWRIRLLDEFLETYPDAPGKLGRSRSIGFARHYLRAARFEHERGRLGCAVLYGLRAAVSDPRATSKGLLEQAPLAAARRHAEVKVGHAPRPVAYRRRR